jgi:hypothetical protein
LAATFTVAFVNAFAAGMQSTAAAVLTDKSIAAKHAIETTRNLLAILVDRARALKIIKSVLCRLLP